MVTERVPIADVHAVDLVLPALEGLGDAYLVGGAVRDVLLGETSVDLDIAVEGDAAALAERLADRLEGELVVHDRFSTATVRARDLVVDIATTRTETYPEPGALPVVQRASIADDLARRDFTVNAMAAALHEPDPGRLVDPHGGRSDLAAGVIRVLHDGSFADDATRLLRAARYAARLGFALEPATERLARAAAASGAVDSVSGPRIRDELLDLLGEHEAPDALALLRDLGIDRALDPALRADPELVAAAKLGSSETWADPVLAGLAALCVGAPDDLAPFVERLGLEASARDAVLRAARVAPSLVAGLRADMQPSELYELLSEEPPEALALALGLGAPGEPVLRFASSLGDMRLEIDGDDLLAAGIAEGPAIGAALRLVLGRVLDGELDGRDEQLDAAIDAAREAS